jgi:hypothetical protein
MNRDDLLDILVGGQTDRDKQTDIGPSEIGGCGRRVWYRINNTPTVNDTLKLAATMGTAIHAHIERRLKILDPFKQRYLTELEVSAHGLTGHVDCYDVTTGEVIDWKTTTKKNMSKAPTDQQRTQVHLYGYLLAHNDYPVNDVTLVFIARDGHETDVNIFTEPYDESVALQGLDWLADIRELAEPPEPEKHRKFCEGFCPYYHSTEGCSGL